MGVGVVEGSCVKVMSTLLAKRKSSRSCRALSEALKDESHLNSWS